MAADQWRKRLNSSSVVACNGREQHRAKRSSSGLSNSNMRSHISLEWDGNQKSVVARRDQLGISWRDIRPFLASPPSLNNVVADVFAVPHEIFGLENLQHVLLYEVWESYLSESEKSHLLQFLPRGPETHQVLQSLLSGDNFHFGNPFLNWGSSLCSGELHPDAIRQKDRHLKTEKKAYYAELHRYHNNMIGDLLKLKERFERSKDPEREIMQTTWRLRTDMDKKNSSSANNSRFHLLENNVEASSESCSSDADEKPSSSDNQNPSTVKGRELQNRVCKKGSLKDGSGNPSLVSGDVNIGAKPRKGDKRQQQNISCNDGAKYMSYVKISKKQHEIVKNMKQSGKSILSRSLNRVLGNIDSFDVQPYEVFIEEEQKKLRDHWIQLANKALPEACANRRDLNLQRQQLRKSLEQDINERLRKLAEDVEDSDSHDAARQDQIENEGEDKSLCGSRQEEFSSGKEFESMDVDSEKQGDDATLNASGSTDGGDVEGGVQLLCGGEVWPTSNMSHSYYGASVSPEYAEGSEEQRVELVEKEMVHREAEEGSFGRNELFQMQSLFKGEEMLMYNDDDREQSMLMPGLGGKREENGDVYMCDHVYSDGGGGGSSRFLMGRQEEGLSVQDWSVNGGVRMAAPPPPPAPPMQQSHWFTGEAQVGNGWSGSGSGSRDQSLYSVLSQCNQLRAAQTEQQLIASRSYANPNQSMGNLAMHHPYEAAPPPADDMGWMGLPPPPPPPPPPPQHHQNDPILRSWNQ